MYTIDESINEIDELEKIVNKIPFTKNRNQPLSNKLSRNKSQIYTSKEPINNTKTSKNNFYNFTLSYKDGTKTKSVNMNESTGIDSTQDIYNFNFKNFKPGNLLFEIFINLSEFDGNKLDFFVSYTNLCSLLREVNIIDKILYTKVIIEQTDLDIILKKIQKNKNSSKKLNYKDFVKFFSYLVYEIDYFHFIEKPQRTLNFNINKFFGGYFKENKMSFISLIYNFALNVQQETNINEIMNPIIPYIKNIFIKFSETSKENINILNDNDNSNMAILKNKFKIIINIMKYFGIFPVLVNLKELVVMFYIQLDDNNDNVHLDVEEIESDFGISFKKFCQLFFCLCLYIKNKRNDILNQYLYLLKEENKNTNFNNELKYGLKEGIIRFILNIKNKNFPQKNNKNTLSKEKFYNELENMKTKDIDFLFRIFESYSSHFDNYLNYQISFSDIIIFLKECGFLMNNKNNVNSNLLLERKYYKAKNKIKNNISNLKDSLHSLDKYFNFNNNCNKKNISISNNYNNNTISLIDIEIFYCKVSKRADVNNRLNFREFIKFLYLFSDKLGFTSFNEFLEYLFNRKNNNLKILKQRNDELSQINLLYYEIKSNEIINIIQEISPIINIYFIYFANRLNKYVLTFDLFIKIFTQFDLYPNIISNNILRNIFYQLYQINKKNQEFKEGKGTKFFEEIKEIGFEEILMAIGVITLYLKNKSNLDEKQILLGIFYKIAESKKLKLDLNLNYNFPDALKNKLIEISNFYYGDSKPEEPEYKSFLENPFL